MRRKAIEALEARKNAIITGFWANDGMNDDKSTRQDALTDLDAQFATAIKVINSGEVRDEGTLTEEDEENPFLAPAIKATREIEAPRADEGTVKDALESEGIDPKEIDQLG